ncbi:MAG: hypothetical protein ABEJ07_01450 [Candidatus Nanohaloarchaea archaeon]
MSDYTTVSFKREFVEDVKEYLDDKPFDSVKSFLKHLAVKDMESEEKISEEEARKIGKKLKDLGYVG